MRLSTAVFTLRPPEASRTAKNCPQKYSLFRLKIRGLPYLLLTKPLLSLKKGEECSKTFLSAASQDELVLRGGINEMTQEVHMETNERDCGRFLKGFLTGSLLGALAGILFAPKSGKELRSELRQMGSETIDKTMQLSSEVQDRASVILDNARRRAEELKREADRQFTEARLKTREILKEAEERAYEFRKSATEVIEEAKKEVKKVREAVEAGVEAAKHEYSKRVDSDKPLA